ncbi:hypothetical protein D9615_005947 [Tricholomella constricta]|uniref:Uncharacterized protein n=1 Tax=Tricholomella constricta TaxID=117010 RepID=A0A8H5H9R8_9AGAR|nr:hypothetical protein D9615_005947 [Tricholomella constricta]
MSFHHPHHSHPMHPAKRIRRSATSVMAGDFDPRPTRDVLTSWLNGVSPYGTVEKDEEERRARKREKKERDRRRKKEKAALRAQQSALLHEAGCPTPDTSYSGAKLVLPPAQSNGGTSSFWKVKARPTIHIPTMQRSVSVTPPPITSPMLLPSTPASTPGPSNSSSTSRTSSKRPRTPDDYEDFHDHRTSTASPAQPRRKRPAVKKGWKGWVEGSPPPSEKLINLDAVPVLQERRTRSGKNFDAIGVGKDGWV